MSAPLGGLIADEVARAEADLTAKRNRALSVLTASGALVTLLTGLLAVAVAQDSGLDLSAASKFIAAAGLTAFVAATIAVLLVLRPVPADAAHVDDLARLVKTNWGDATLDRDVAMFLVDYLRSLRKANENLSTLLKAAIACEVLGVALTALLAVSLLIESAT